MECQYPHQGPDKRLLGCIGAWICQKLSFDSHVLPRLLLVTYMLPPGFKLYWGLWMLRAGWHYDYNAKAYIFGFAAKKASEQSL